MRTRLEQEEKARGEQEEIIAGSLHVCSFLTFLKYAETSAETLAETSAETCAETSVETSAEMTGWGACA